MKCRRSVAELIDRRAGTVPETPNPCDVRFRGAGTAVVVAATVAACGTTGGTKPIYQVRVTAESDPVTLLGCRECPLTVNPHGEVGFVEKRRLPMTYRIVVRGRVTQCPTMRAIRTIPHAKVDYGLDWFLIASRSGCTHAPIGASGG
jgi:hypothetical protein